MSSFNPYLHVSYRQEAALFDWSIYRLAGTALLILGVVVYPLVASPFFVQVGAFALIASIGAIGLQVVTGMAGQLSLGHSAFLAIGAFVAGGSFFHWGWPFWVALPAAMVAGGVVGLLAGFPALRLRGLYLGITTLAVQSVVSVLGLRYHAWLQKTYATSSDITVSRPDLGLLVVSGNRGWYYVLAVLGAASVLAVTNLRRSKYGRIWRAVHDNEVAAEALGVDVGRAKLLAFVVAGMLGALAGVLHAYTFTTVRIETFDLLLSVEYLAMIIVGGLGSVAGAVLGASFITAVPFAVGEVVELLGLEALVARRIRAIELGVFAIITGVFLLVEPGGLVVMWRRLQGYFARWPFRYETVTKTQR